MSARLHTHSPLPAPALHASVAVAQSKSHVLAGVQDAYWSDDEAEDAECPLCLEEMDISDLNFKPCQCGYQICRFCWHHIKENLNGRCPACRRPYTDEAVQFKPINKEDHKRLTQQKKQRERERKELDALSRRHLANVRVVQRNVVYVVGIGPRFAKEELIPTLRSNEYFGQYGKISKIVLVKRTPSGGRAPVVGLYITYHRREDAARAIAAVDGAPSPGGGNETLRASYGTTKYCMAFLRGVSCQEHGCMNLHEWGDEKDCFTKEDLTTLKHTMKDTESRSRTTTGSKSAESDGGLPRGASWANKGANSTPLHVNAAVSNQAPVRSVRRTGITTTPAATTSKSQRSSSSTALASAASEIRSALRKGTSTTTGKATSRPSTPANTQLRPTTPATTRQVKPKEPVPPVPAIPPRSPTSVESDVASNPPDAIVSSSPHMPPDVPPAAPAVPPGLSAPPGLPPPVRANAEFASPPPLGSQTSQSSYQMSTQAQALMEDLRARRESALLSTTQSPFPDLDRTLRTLSAEDGSGFSFNLDPKFASDEQDTSVALPDLTVEPAMPFGGSFFDAFPGLRQGATPPTNSFMLPPGLSYPSHLHRSLYDQSMTRATAVDRHSTGGSSYTGSFNPFAETVDEAPSRRFSPLDEERRVSRFGFARGRQGSTSSPYHTSSPLSNSESLSHLQYFSSSELASPVNHSPGQWPFHTRHQQSLDFPHTSSTSALSSPLVSNVHSVTQSPYIQQQQPQSRFMPFDSDVSEAQLREFIHASRDRATPSRNGPPDQPSYRYNSNQPFSDPAIMTARLASPVLSQQQAAHDGFLTNPSSTMESFTFAPPPGLGIQDFPSASAISHHSGYNFGIGPSSTVEVSQTSGSVHVSTSTSPVPSPALSSSDFPALSAADITAVQPSPSEGPSMTPSVNDDAAKAKAERKAAKKAAATERAVERQRIAQEKALVRAAEKERIAAEKAAEKERIAAEKAAEKERLASLKVEKEKAAKEKAEKEKIERELQAEKDRDEREKAEKERREREQAAKERTEKEKAEKERIAQTKKVEQAAKAATHPKATLDAASDASKAAARKGSMSKPAEPVIHTPILSKMPKKNKPVAKPIKIPKEEHIPDSASAIASAATSDAPQLPETRTSNSSNNSRSHSVDRVQSQPASLQELLAEIELQFPWVNISKHPFFDPQKINPAAKMPLEYAPLVHALSALSVGGGSFANNMPSGSIDNAVSSFQQLLETLTQTISDLLRLLPRTTWDDSSSFDGVLRDMLKGDDFLDDGGEDNNGAAPAHAPGQGKEDEVAALTQALERRARWMEVQLSKLEELHRDINTAAVRAVLSFNDAGWDPHGFLPRVGNTLQRFDQIGLVILEEGGEEGPIVRAMAAEELEKKMHVAKEAAAFAEAELREAVQNMENMKPKSDQAI